MFMITLSNVSILFVDHVYFNFVGYTAEIAFICKMCETASMHTRERTIRECADTI